MNTRSEEVLAGGRFEFGANWNAFLAHLDDLRIQEAEKSLCDLLEMNSLAGKTFLDIGCGSGLFSLAARRLGATVVSFDYDPISVACAVELRRRYFSDDNRWSISEGSVLDGEFMGKLPEADIVYSWGVLHHTGQMWNAVDAAAGKVTRGGKLFIALYNDQGGASGRWLAIKKLYNRMPAIIRPGFVAVIATLFETKFALARLLRGKWPFATKPGQRRKYDGRGMSPWHDWVDWVGGLPFEVAKPEEVLHRLRPRGFLLCNLLTLGGGWGCNQFVFQRTP